VEGTVVTRTVVVVGTSVTAWVTLSDVFTTVEASPVSMAGTYAKFVEVGVFKTV
jgi:hypothetical protein